MSYDLIFQQALNFHNKGQFEQAEQLYRQILDTTPHHPIILNLLGLIAQTKGLHSQAIDYFSKAITQNPQSAEYYFNMAWSLERINKPAEAIKTYNRALQLQPDIKEAYNALGNLYLSIGKNKQAEHYYNQAALYDINYAEPRANLAKMKKNLQELKRLEEKYPQDSIIPYYISILHQENKDLSQAINAAQKALILNKDEITLLHIGELYIQNNEVQQSLTYFQQALELNPKCVSALINLANYEPSVEKAEQMYKKALDIAPQNVDAHLNYAELLYREKRLSESLEEYRQAVILAPDCPEISNNLGIIEKDVGEYEEAVGLFFNALQKQPDRQEYALNITETLMLLHEKDPKYAQKITKNWLKNTPDNIFAQRLSQIFNSPQADFDENAQHYTAELFNLFADNYEEVMQNIDYQIPQKMAEILGNLNGTIIDLGCGTGLSGEVFKTANNHLIGIDISPLMIKKAQAKKIYDTLIIADINNYCQNLPSADWVIAADVLGYIGNLNLLKNIFPKNLCFSIAINDESNKDYKLTSTGRYKHNPNYVKKLLQKAGYSHILEQNLVLRKEKGQEVNGIIFTAKEK